MTRRRPARRSDRFTLAERRLIGRLRTPAAVQAYLNALPYNTEPGGATLRSFRGVVDVGTAHCFEAAMFACVVLEQHGYPPLVLSFESIDHLDHVLFVYRHDGRWGSVARSRDPGLHGRKPVFRDAARAGADLRGRLRGLHGRRQGLRVADMREVEGCDWRFSPRNVWKAEQFLLDYPHHRIRPSRGAHRQAARALRRVPGGARRLSRWTTSGASAGCPHSGRVHGRAEAAAVCGTGLARTRDGRQVRDRRAFVPIDLSRDRSRVGLVIGSLLRLAQRLLEALRQGVAARLLGLHRLLEERFAPRRFLREDALRVVSSGLSPRSGAWCSTMRSRLRSKTSVAPQQGQVSSSSDFRRDMPV